MKKAALIMAYGSPNKLEDILPFYTDIRRGNAPTEVLLEELTERYISIGGSSPLLKVTNAQAELAAEALEMPAYVGMRHWEPWVHEAVEQMQKDGVTHSVGMVMAPHFSTMSIAKYIGKVETAMKDLNYDLKINFIESWNVEPEYIQALMQKIETALGDWDRADAHYIFTAHSLPARILDEGDPYPNQLMETAKKLAYELGIDESSWSFAFQSAGRTTEKWLGPDLLEKIDELELAGKTKLLICSIGFITDHLEVMYDIDIEAQDHIKNKDMAIRRADSLNADPLLGKLFGRLISEKMKELEQA